MKKKIVYMISAVLVLLTVLSGCSTTQKIENIKEIDVPQKELIPEKELSVEKEIVEVPSDNLKVHLISTTHNKGNLFPYDVVKDTSSEYSLMNVAGYVKGLRESGENVVLLNSGDNLLHNPLLYYYNNVETKQPHIVSRLYNEIGYDVVSVGQRDGEVDQEVYMKILDESNYPYIGANIVDEVSKKPVVDPYVMIEKGGVSIAVVGLTDPLGSPWFLEGITFDDMVETAFKWIPIIREKENADVIVALVSSDQENFSEMAASIVSNSQDGFDIIIGGTSVTPKVVKDLQGKDVHIVGSMSKGESVNHLEVVFNQNGEEGKLLIASITSKDVAMSGVKVDQGLLDSYKDVVDEVTSWAQTKVGEINETLSSRDAMFKDSAFVDTIHSLQRALSLAEISISAPLSVNTRIEKGIVRIVDLFRLYPQYDRVYTMNLTGAEIRDMANYSYGKWFHPMSKLDDDIIKFKKDANGDFVYNNETNSFTTNSPVSSFDSYSGMNYIVNIAKPKEVQVVIKTMEKGSAFSINSSYTVALNSSRARGEGGHLEAAGITKEMAKEKLVAISEKDVMYYLMKEIQKYRIIELSYDNNWLVIPALWSTKGMENSYPKLFGEMLK